MTPVSGVTEAAVRRAPATGRNDASLSVIKFLDADLCCRWAALALMAGLGARLAHRRGRVDVGTSQNVHRTRPAPRRDPAQDPARHPIWRTAAAGSNGSARSARPACSDSDRSWTTSFRPQRPPITASRSHRWRRREPRRPAPSHHRSHTKDLTSRRRHPLNAYYTITMGIVPGLGSRLQVGREGFEPPPSPLSGVRSHQPELSARRASYRAAGFRPSKPRCGATLPAGDRQRDFRPADRNIWPQRESGSDRLGESGREQLSCRTCAHRRRESASTW